MYNGLRRDATRGAGLLSASAAFHRNHHHSLISMLKLLFQGLRAMIYHRSRSHEHAV